MKTVPMSFKGFRWHHNPKTVKFVCGRRVNEHAYPSGFSESEDNGDSCIRVYGEGELFGDDCAEQFESLLRLYRSGGAGVLVIDKLTPLTAVFEELRLIGEPRENVLGYAFVFREADTRRTGNMPERHIAAEGENLWDISYLYGIPIDTLVSLNPRIKRPDIVNAGEVIALA